MHEDIVGKFAENAVKVFLERDGYTVIPYGIEHTLREIASLDEGQYNQLRLSEQIRRTPDFFVLSPERGYYKLLEVKYRSGWSEPTREGLEQPLLEQLRGWKRVFVLIALKNPSGPVGEPDSHIRVADLYLDGLNLSVYCQDRGVDKQWRDVDWNDLYPVERAFHDCKAAVRWLRANAQTYNLDPNKFVA